MELGFSKGDLLAGQPITPGWYKGSVKSEEIVNRDGVIDYKITLDFDDTLLKADERFVDHTFFTCLTKGKGFLVPFIAAILNKNVKEIVDAMESGTPMSFAFGESQNVGKKIQFLVSNETYQGRIQNRVQNFLPYNAEPPLA